MSIFRDIGQALREGFDELLSQPSSRDGVDEVLGLLEADLAEARAELDVALRDEQKLKARIDQERRDAERLRERAQESVDRGDDELGRELVRRRRRTLRGVEILESQWSEHQQLIVVLERHIDELEDKLQEMRLRSDFLRTRHRVHALRERYERYRREYGLDAEPLEPGDDELEAKLQADALSEQARIELPAEPEPELEDETEEPERLTDAATAPARSPEAREGRGEVPREDEPGELVPRRRRRRDSTPVIEYESPWDLPLRDIRIERERILRDIERRYRDSDDADIEAELARLKGDEEEPAPPPAEPAPAPPPPEPATPKPAEDDGPDAPA